MEEINNKQNVNKIDDIYLNENFELQILSNYVPVIRYSDSYFDN